MITVSQAIVVEGKYDKSRLRGIVDAPVIVTDGFAIFQDGEKLELLRRLAAERGLIIMTDSDVAGFRIRRYIAGALPSGQVCHAYIPDVLGKERRKEKPSCEGKLGVEGIASDLLIKALEQAGARFQTAGSPKTLLSKVDFYEAGLTGGPDSARRRHELKQRLGLPEHIGPNALLEAAGILLGREGFEKLVEQLGWKGR